MSGGNIYTPRYHSFPDLAQLATHLEDTPMVNFDRGVFCLAVRNDHAATIVTSDNGDYSQISVDDRGQVFVVTNPSPAEPWQVLRTFAGAVADVATPAVIQVIGPGIVDLSALVYPVAALVGLTVTVNGQTCTFVAGDVTSMANILAALNLAITDMNWTAPGPPNFLIGTKLTPGNIVLSGTALATLGIAAFAGTTGPWVTLPLTASMVEVGFVPGFSVANAPQEVILRLWRLSAATGGVADIAGEMRIAASDINTQEARRFSFDGSGAYVTVAFVGGAAPTITGTLDIRPVYDGDYPVESPTWHAVGPSILALDHWDNAPTLAVHNYSVSRGDATAAWASNTTITLTMTAGITAPTSSQLRRVRVFVNATTKPLDWEQDRNAVLSYAAGVVTVNALDGTVITVPAAATAIDVMWEGPDKNLIQEDAASTSLEYVTKLGVVRRDTCVSSGNADGDWVFVNQDADGYLYTRDKSYDAATNALRNLPVWSPVDRRTPGDAAVALIGAAQNVGAAWADLGPEIATMGYTFLIVWLDLTIHDSQNVRIRALAKHTSAGADEYTFPIRAVDVSGTPYNVKIESDYAELNVDADQKLILIYPLYNAIPYIQMRVMAEVAGATPGHFNTALVTYGFGGAS